MNFAYRFASLSFALLLGLSLVLAPAARAQEAASAKTLRGTVRAADTDASLPSVNIFVEGTRRGTITNREGRYRLQIDALPATVVFQYVGYEKARLRVTEGTPAEQDVTLASATAELEGVTVRAERESGADIMRRVIASKQERRRRLRTFKADAYNRFVVRNDTGIVSVVESLTDFFWDKEKGIREVVRSQRQTENMGLSQVLPAGLFVTNLYDDEINVAGYRLPGVTSPDALDHYRFRIDTVRALGERAVFDIQVRPRNRLKTAFIGRISVLDEVYALLSADLKPARSFLFPPPIRDLSISYQQQFSDFGKDFWLPVSLRSEVRAKVELPVLLSIPTFRIAQVSRLSDYEVNVALPDSLYDEEEEEEDLVRTAGLSEREEEAPGDSLIAAKGAAVVPLASEEARAVATIDSTQTLDKAFKPSGPLASLLELSASVNDEEVASTGDPDDGERDDEDEGGLGFTLGTNARLWFNRVEGAHLGGEVTLAHEAAPVTLSALAGYQTARSEWTYGGGLEAALPAKVDFEATYRHGVDLRYSTQVYNVGGGSGRLINSLNVLRGADDYFDYYGNERVRARLSRPLALPLGDHAFGEGRVRAGLRLERSFPVERHTSYDLLGRGNQQPLNPRVPEIDLRSVAAGLTLGDDSPAARLGVSGQRRLSLAAEWAPDGFLGGDTDFLHVEGSLEYEWETFLQRRLLPMSLTVRLSGGTFAGRLPLQRFTIVEAPLGAVGPFGTLRTLEDGRPYEGEQHLAAFWEHNFRTAPFEALGLYGTARRGWNVLLFGGHGRTWVGEARQDRLALAGTPLNVPDGFHHEVGVGLSGLLGLFRVDVAKRLDASGWAVSLGLARIF